jgi:cyclophilin family peptidyl-prolyl cis-trans isomerase
MNKLVFVGLFVVVLAVISWYVFSSQKPSPSPQPSQTTSEDDATDMKKTYNTAPSMTIDTNKIYTANMVTSKGNMTIMLFAKETPVTVNNFVFLAREEFYNNTVFHRIIKGFMIQGGDPLGTGTGGPGYRFNDEQITRDYIRGTIAMANAGPNTNGSQFFIVHQTTSLPKNYVIFGAIDTADSASLATLDAIANIPVGQSASGENSKPLEPVTLTSVTIEEK